MNHGIVGFAYLAGGRIAFTTHRGHLYLIDPTRGGAPGVEAIGWLHPEGEAPIAHLAGGLPVGGAAVDGGYLLKAWTRDKPQLSTIEDGDLLIAGVDLRYQLPRDLGPA